MNATTIRSPFAAATWESLAVDPPPRAPATAPGLFGNLGSAVIDFAPAAAGEVFRVVNRKVQQLSDERMRRDQLDADPFLAEDILKRRVEVELESQRRDVAARDFVQRFTPDPAITGAGSQIVYGLGKTMVKAVPAMMAVGPVAGAVVAGALEGGAESIRLQDQGVDAETAGQVGLATGITTAFGFALPVAGATWARTAALAAAGGPASFMSQQQAARIILDRADYSEIAQQYDPFDPVGLTVSTAGSFLFGAGAMALRARAARAPADALPPVTAEQEAAARTVMLSEQAELFALHAPDDLSAAPQHVEALQTAGRQLDEGKPVDVAKIAPVDDAEIEVRARAAEIPRYEGLNETDRAIETRFANDIARNYDALVRRYVELEDTQNGRVINTDVARELSDDYLADRTKSGAVHEPASYFIKRYWQQKLAEPAPEGRHNAVLFTAGGTGAGKTSAIEIVPSLRSLAEQAQLIYDTNMNTASSAIKKIDQAIDAGKDVHIALVVRDPEEALRLGAIPRAMKQKRKFGSGRTVPLSEHAKTHNDVVPAIEQLIAHYRSNPHVNFSFIDNGLGRGNAVEVELDAIKAKRYTTTVEQLRAALDDEYRRNNLDAETYRGFAGEDPPEPRGAGSDQPVAPVDRRGPGGQSQRERPATGPPRESGTGQAAEVAARPGGVLPPEETSTVKAAPGTPFLAFRVGTSEGLDNRNAGNAQGVADFMASADDAMSSVAEAKGGFLYVYAVTPKAKFGKYETLTRGKGATAETIGRRDKGKGTISYSFPPGSADARVVAKIPMAQVRERLAAAGFQDFDDAGSANGAKIIRELAKDYIAGRPPIAGASGNSVEIVTERGAAIQVRYRAVEVGQLVTSHDDALRVNPDFPAELQPRDRTRAASEQQIAKIENRIDPELLAENRKASDGAPVIGPDGVVESGNARTIAVRRAYAGGKADAYRAWLIDNAERFGLNRSELEAMERPLLVRETPGGYDRAEFARQANEQSTARMSAPEQAKTDATRMPDMDGLAMNEDGSINQAASRGFIRDFLGKVVSPAEQGDMVTGDGMLSSAGLQRIRNALFAKAYGDPELVSMLTESTDANIRNILNGMMRAAGDMAKLRDMIESGARQPADFSGDLALAARQFSKLRAEGTPVEAFLAQGNLIDSPVTPEVGELLRALSENARSGARVADLIQRMIADVDSLGDPRQAGMFDAPAASVRDVAGRVGKAMRDEADAAATAQGTLDIGNAAREAIDADPALKVKTDPDGEPVPARQVLDDAKKQADDVRREADALRAAIDCGLRRG